MNEERPTDWYGREHVGGKAHVLHCLDRAGIPVPKWEVLGTELFDQMLRSLESEPASGDGEQLPSRMTALLEAPMPGPVQEAILSAYSSVGKGRISVRSSATAEDSSSASFAGIFKTQLNVSTEAEVIQAVRQCWASVFAEEVTAYQKARRQSAGLKMAVILQAMVDPECSGVLFTQDTVHGDHGAALVSSVYGLGEGLVSGAIDADTIVVNRNSLAITSAEVGEKLQRITSASSASGVAFSAVPPTEAAQLAVTEAQLKELVRRGLELERLFAAPQDIEWAFSKGQLWILQSRPISVYHTARPVTADPDDSTMRIWDNSNIIESFGGISSPLTFTMANYIYGRVYTEYYRVLGVPQKDLDSAAGWMQNMLGYMHGRVYYNLLNWYKMLRAQPFYRANRRQFETSIGVDEPLDDDLANSITAFDGRKPLVRWLLRLKMGLLLLGMWLNSGRHVRGFLTDFYRVFTRFEDIDYAAMDAGDIYRHFVEFEREVVTKWGRMVALEAVISLTYAPLLMLTKSWVRNAPEWLAWEVAKPPEGLESVEPAAELDRLADTALQSPAALDVIVRGGRMDQVRAEAEAKFLEALDSYLARFAYRSANELKLEAPTLAENPEPLLESLRVRIEQRDRNDVTPIRDAIDVNKLLYKNMGPLKRPVYAAMRRKVQRSLAARERVRFCRTRAFGVVKRMMRGMGNALADEGILAEPDDIYMIQLNELRGLFEGSVLHRSLRETASVRRRILDQDAERTIPSRFRTWGFVYQYLDSELKTEGSEPADIVEPGFILNGTPTSPGIVEAEALVTTTPQACDGNILIAYSTDPSWVTVLSTARGLIIERGSPLTHVAIIAREMNIPTVTKVPGITKKIQTGWRIRMDGAAGTIQVLAVQESVQGTV